MALSEAPELDTAYLLIYVDDIILTASSTSLLQRIISLLHAEFAMTDLGPLNYFISISATRTTSGIFLSQTKYATEILEQAQMLNCNPCRTPIDTEKKLGPEGSPSTTSQLIAYSDADWAGCPATRRSTSGYCIFLGDNLLTWSSKCQDTLSRSSAEAEYLGVVNAIAETSWIRNLLRKLHTPLFTTTLVYYDNVSAVYMSANPVQHQRTKHIEIDIHFVRDKVAAGHVRVLHVPSRFQYADIFTKGLPYPLFADFRSSWLLSIVIKQSIKANQYPLNTSNVEFSSVSNSKFNKDVKRYSRKDLLSCNNSHHVGTRSAYACNDDMNVSCNSRLYASYDVNDLFIFDDVSIRKSRVSKMPFMKKPRDSLNVRSKSNSNNSLPRTLFRWLPKMQPLAELVAKWIPKIVQICLWIIDSGCSNHMIGNRALLTNFVEKFLGTVRFGNNDFAMITGYRDVVIGSMTIKKVYYVEGLGHNLFSVGQFCDKGLEVAFRKSSCFVRTKDGVDLLTGDRSSNLYAISLNDIASNSSACLLAKASLSQSWLWHQCLSPLNFATINNLVKNNLVRGLPKMKFAKDHLCSSCEQGKIHQKHNKSKTAFASNKPLYLLHMDLCGPMRVKSINGKRCYLLNDFDDVGKLHAKGDIGVFVGYSKESAAFRIYNKHT
ncbi:integrase, catalytic region, zinc finger, CCHC-type containing protein [Tanacetum coccineum]